MGCCAHRGHFDGRSDSPSTPVPGAKELTVSVCRHLRGRLHPRGAGGAAGRDLHRRHPAAAAAVRRRSDGVLRVHRQSALEYQRHTDQLRLSAHRTLPADVLHLRGGAAHRDGPLVHSGCPHVGARPARTAEEEPSGGGLGIGGDRPRSPRCWRPRRGRQDDKVDEPPRRRSAAERPSRSTSRSGKPASRTAPLAVTTCPAPGHGDHRARGRPATPPAPPQAGRAAHRTAPQAALRVGPAQGDAALRSPHRIRAPRASAPLRRGPAAPAHGSNGNGTHHPVSRVRYRGGEDGEDYAQHRRRRPRDRAVESWEYDI